MLSTVLSSESAVRWRVTRTLQKTSRPPLAVREDGGVVWSSDGAPFAHPVSCLL